MGGNISLHLLLDPPRGWVEGGGVSSHIKMTGMLVVGFKSAVLVPLRVFSGKMSTAGEIF